MIHISAKTIAVIGAGPSGLAAAKYCVAEKCFSKIVLFEQRSSTGGVWHYTPDDRTEEILTVPQTNPNGKIEKPIWKERDSDGESKTPVFVSPVYERLETNIPRGLMGFSDLNWPSETQLFPKHQNVLSYVQKYGEGLQHLVRFETQVMDVVPANSSATGSWKVKTRDLRSGAKNEEVFDAVVVANGHFITPYIPDIPGIKEWNEMYPGSIIHSKYYRRPEEYTSKKTIVIGASSSGYDISTQIAAFSQTPLLWSIRAASPFLSPTASASALRETVPPITSLDPHTRTAHFSDGTTASSIDALVFATGYFYSLPFLQNLHTADPKWNLPPVVGNGTHIQHTYKHLFYAARPTLSFVALPQRVIPFPVAEGQSAILARVYSGRLALPSTADMEAWYQARLSEPEISEDVRKLHLLPFPKDGVYINGLAAWARSAERREGLENDGVGKKGQTWGKREFWLRQNFPAIRGKFTELGVEERAEVRTLEELGGFEFPGDEYEVEGMEFERDEAGEAAAGDVLL